MPTPATAGFSDHLCSSRTLSLIHIYTHTHSRARAHYLAFETVLNISVVYLNVFTHIVHIITYANYVKETKNHITSNYK